MSRIFKDIKLKIEELSTIFGFIKQKSIKEVIYKDITKIEDSLSNLNNELENLQEKYKDTALKNKLISKLLSASSSSEGLSKYKKILEDDFLEFAKEEESTVDEVKAIYKLQSIQKELELITIYPELYKKNIIAVGGGFSAGKSRFINSLLEDNKIKLPVGSEPTTAIPTYVIHDEKEQFIGCNQNGGVVDLYKLDKSFHSKLSHEFIKSFEFNLNKIMPFMIIGTSINKFQNLCFVDTPGYDSSDMDEGFTNEDKDVAERFLENSETLLWLISIKGGTIPKSDRGFLQRLDLENKSLYIILNKSDLITEFEIKKVIEEIKKILSTYRIDYQGISAYSSTKKQEISYSKKSIYEFLESINDMESKVQEKLVEKLYDVKEMYEDAINKDIDNKKDVINTAQSLSLDFSQKGLIEESDLIIYERLDKLKKIFSVNKQQKNLEQLKEVVLKLQDAIDEIFGKKSILKKMEIKRRSVFNFLDNFLP